MQPDYVDQYRGMKLTRDASGVLVVEFHSNRGAVHVLRAGYSSFAYSVFCKKDGSPLHPDVLRKDVLYPILDRLGISRSSGASGFHTFRHSAASIILISRPAI